MTDDFYILAIAALLPITACILVFQVNPYHALVIRGILGAVAALVYAIFGAADVALTEALVGTMLSITLYAVAVRSSLSMRIGILENEVNENSKDSKHRPSFEELLSSLRMRFDKYHMRLELVPYQDLKALQAALTAKDVHTTCVLSDQVVSQQSLKSSLTDGHALYHLQTRVRRLYDIMQVELPETVASLTYVKSSESQRVSSSSDVGVVHQ